jgi:MFS family permease
MTLGTESNREEAAPEPGPLREVVVSLAAVFRSRNLRRMQLALAGSMIGDWAYATAVVVWAYDVGGARAVGIFASVRLLLMAVAAPLASNLADRYPRQAVMIAADLLRAVVVVAAVLCLYADTPAAPVFVLATLASLLGCVFRPAQMALVPALAENPRELAASNGAASTIESLAFFLGPALGALLVTVTDVETVFLVNAVTFLWSAVLVASIRPRADDGADSAAEAGEGPPDPGGVLAGFVHIWRDRGLLLVAFLISTQTIVAGASTVFAVLFAVEYLDTGPEGVGYVDSVFGVGAIVGGFFAIARAARNRLTQDLGAGTFLWAFPLLAVALWPSPASVFAVVLVMGFANPLVDVNFATIVQRIAPERVLGRVFGAFEGILIGTMALGAAAMPFLVDWLGLRVALVVIALAVAGPVLLVVPAIRRLDTTLRAPEALPLLRSLPMFAPLAPSVVEALARQVTRVQVPAGTVVLREGEESDRFYVIESGRVRVTQADRVLREEGAGEFFGEIGLLRDVPRTATITAVEDAVLLALTRSAFLDAVTGSREASTAADDVVSRRLAF